jgi:hypothetical protein
MSEAELLVQSSGVWKTKALERHKALHLDYPKMIAWYDLISSTVGDTWLAAQSSVTSSKARTLANVHPLHRLLNEGADTALITVCELGQYLEAFTDDPAVPQIAKDLISPKFLSTLFELAMAYRWRISGGDIVLQASAAGKRVGDFSVLLNEVPFLIEASNISTEVFEKLSFRAPLLIKNAVAGALPDGAVLQIKLILRADPSGEWEQTLRRSVKECCYEIRKLSDSGKPPSTFREASWYRIDAERLPIPPKPEHEDDPSEIWDVRFDQVTETKPYELQLRVLIRFPADEEPSGPRILKKLDKEARQLRGVRGARVVLLDISGIEPDVLKVNAEAFHQELRKELTQTPELACIWLVTRGWTTAMRYQYRVMHIPNPESPFQLPHSFLKRFVLKEWRWDFLGGTQLEDTTEEEAVRRFLGRQPVFEGYIDNWQ